MELDELRDLLLSMPTAVEETPFGPDVLVFRLGPKGKMFALTGIDDVPSRVNLKCDPERAIELREEYPDSILPGYHMNKQQWNTVLLDGSVPRALVEQLAHHSWELVVAGLKNADRKRLGLAETAG